MIYKCKMCGGDLIIENNSVVCECEYCGSKQTIPTADNEKKMNLFNRANYLRLACEFDKAAGIYENILAEYSAESEAYWGLCLCKYGIEYVDDPLTGKKIPTCHRTSYQSIFEDENFQAALDYADSVATSVYREEAKEIDRIQKSILDIASKEEPFDVFICYKETDEKGERTKDSVLAQDIYDVLTDKGYKVFFSRITLEDKLGQEYEPYIFSALNSAKVMLAIGTKYEYYNAVWVRNEWSRFLEMRMSDKEKTLIPCYADIDPYDMPAEFKNLQGQDMGKVGFIQDLLRGIAKIVGKDQVKTETIVFAGNGSGNESQVVQRGFIALEDGDWNNAKIFFDQALNLNAKSAESYMGQALAALKCHNIEEFVTHCIGLNHESEWVKKLITPDEASIQIKESVMNTYTIPGYLEADTIADLFNIIVPYYDKTNAYEKQLKEEEEYFETDRLISKAYKYAEGEYAQKLASAKEKIFTEITHRRENALVEEHQDMAVALQTYKEKVEEAKQQALKLFSEASYRQETDYMNILSKMESAKTSQDYYTVEKMFGTMNGYKDCVEKREECRQLGDIQKKKEDKAAELERQRKAAEIKRRWKKIIVIASSICAVIFIICVLSYINKNVIQPKRKYDKAIELIDNHNYEEGYELLKELGTYKDSLDYVTENMYQRAVDAFNKGDYKEAQLLFSDIEDYSDAISYLKKLKEELEYEDALALYEQGNTDLLFEKYESSDNTKIVDLNQKANYEIAIKLCDEKKYEEAIEYLSKCGEYLDAKEKLNEIAYDAGCNWMKRGFLNKASDCFAKVKDDYEDCQKKKELCDEYKKYTGAWMQKSTGVTFKIYVKLDDGFEKALVNYDSSYGIYSFEIAQIDDDVLRYQDRYYSRHASEDCMSDVNLTITWVTEDKSNIKLEVKDVPKYVSLWMPNCYGTLERIETY